MRRRVKAPASWGARWLAQCPRCGWACHGSPWAAVVRAAHTHGESHADRSALAQAVAAPGSLRPWPFSTHPDDLTIAR